jgi:eukaryotic-like serine/threonine-protein kinase
MVESRRGDIFKPGDLLNNTYRIEKVLGRGGTSEVYQARNEVSGRFVAIKALKSEFAGDEGFLTLMRREEEIREIRHDAVVRYSENHRTPDGHIYLVMDYVEGPALDSLLKAGGVSADDLLSICARVAQGLRVAHNRNIVHRDLSPDNIILRAGKPEEAVIIDFGIAKDTNPGAETIVGNEFAGKYAYAAPEQLSGQTDRRTDIYSLGALLLAAFRGANPDVGRNPMEVLQKKALPLDTSGVPEPLKSLIDRMTAPDPAQRFQTAEELLAALGDTPDEGTVIVPRRPQTIPPSGAGIAQPAARQPTATPVVTGVPPARNAAPPPAARKSRAGLFVVVGLVVIGGAGAGGYLSGAFDSFLGPRIPVADPYTLIVENPAEGAPLATGSVPDETTATAITAFMATIGGTADLALATGAIAETWGLDVLATLNAVGPLDEWRLAVSGNTADLSGVTNDPTLRDSVQAALGTDLPGALIGQAAIQLGPLILSAAQIDLVLSEFADCGPLSLIDPPEIGYPAGSTVTVSGALANVSSRASLIDALHAIAGDREIVVEAETLNPTLCLVDAVLPDAPPAGVGFVFGFGDRPEQNPSAVYRVGENPVIDIVLPADMTDGYVWVSILDVSGNIFHLLPRNDRKNNSVSWLRDGQDGPLTVRMTYPLDAEGESVSLAEPGFKVDETQLGKSRIIVIHSENQIFPKDDDGEDALRPSESVGSFTDALLNEAVDSANILSVDGHILITEAVAQGFEDGTVTDDSPSP